MAIEALLDTTTFEADGKLPYRTVDVLACVCWW